MGGQRENFFQAHIESSFAFKNLERKLENYSVEDDTDV